MWEKAALTRRFHSTQSRLFNVSNKMIYRTSIFSWRWTAVGLRCSRRPPVLLVCHSDEGKEPPLSERLLFCFVGALRSLPQQSPCRCRPRVDLYAAVHRWLLRDGGNKFRSSIFVRTTTAFDRTYSSRHPRNRSERSCWLQLL